MISLRALDHVKKTILIISHYPLLKRNTNFIGTGKQSNSPKLLGPIFTESVLFKIRVDLR